MDRLIYGYPSSLIAIRAYSVTDHASGQVSARFELTASTPGERLTLYPMEWTELGTAMRQLTEPRYKRKCAVCGGRIPLAYSLWAIYCSDRCAREDLIPGKDDK